MGCCRSRSLPGKREETCRLHIDAFKAENNVKAVNTLTPKWDDAASNEDKLGRIITQKWLAMYPEGGEA